MARPKKPAIQEVAISVFKARCLGMLDKVNKTKTPLRITRRGRPIADVIPASCEAEGENWLGALADSIQIAGDIVSPVIDLDEIEAVKD